MAPGSRVSIQDVLDELLPAGTPAPPNETVGADIWQFCPPWPADLFGVAATLAERSGAYTEMGLVLSKGVADRNAKVSASIRSQQIGSQWREQGYPPQAVQTLWSALLAHRAHHVCDETAASAGGWKDIALKLLAIADEAATGFGFIPTPDVKSLATLVLDAFVAVQRSTELPPGGPPYVPNSLCILISPDRLCVLPKALTPQVGCNLRSLSHHLALLPGIGVVKPTWYIGTSSRLPAMDDSGTATADQRKFADFERFNLLLVPFPYMISRSGFRQTCPAQNGLDGLFGLDMNWMEHDGEEIAEDKITTFIADLIRTTERDVGEIHAIVLPESSLPRDVALSVAAHLARTFPHVELLIAGVMHEDHNGVRNEALLARLEGEDRPSKVLQGKHHRWRIDPRQVNQYQLGRQLGASHSWWEDINVHNRELAFGLSRANTVIAALICEDLARFDPVLPVLNSIGPNLVIALLMDGPQLQSRWPGRYATVLAEDPGSAVLTLTSIGMIDLSRRHNEEPCRVIALWKDASGPATELLLPQGAQALTLSLKAREQVQYSMDLRSDEGAAISLTLESVWPVVLSNPPEWLIAPKLPRVAAHQSRRKKF